MYLNKKERKYFFVKLIIFKTWKWKKETKSIGKPIKWIIYFHWCHYWKKFLIKCLYKSTDLDVLMSFCLCVCITEHTHITLIKVAFSWNFFQTYVDPVKIKIVLKNLLMGETGPSSQGNVLSHSRGRNFFWSDCQT